MLAMFWRTHIHRPPAAKVARKERLSYIIFRLDSLGDVVMTTPLFRALKMAHPRSRCTVVVRRGYKSLLATNPHIDEILTLPNIRPAWMPQSLRRLLAATFFYWTQLRGKHFDYAISPRWDVDEHFATFLCVLTNAATRVGYSEQTTAAKQRMNRGFDRAYSLCLLPGPVQHEVLRNLVVAEALGATARESALEINVTEQDRKHAAKLLAKVPASANLLAIGIGAHSAGRRWPLEHYGKTAAQLQQRYDVQVVIVCSGPELGEALKLAALLPRVPVIVSGARLRHVCAVLERCELFIGNDSGSAHLAAAMGCKTLVISRHPAHGDPNHFNSPVRFAPYCRLVHVLQPAAGLEGCETACRTSKPHCITQVSVDEVVAAAQHMMTERPPIAEEVLAPRWADAAHVLLHTHSREALQAAIGETHAAGARPSL